MDLCSLLYLLPKNLLSYITGRLAHLRLPSSWNLALIRWFAARYRVNLNELALPLESYPSLGEFFTRDLAAGVRPISGELVSPVDAHISEFGPVEDGLLLQVKGRAYTMEALLRDSKLAEQFEGGQFITFYLAPGDYHHIHSPISGRVIRTSYIPGALWPVNEWSLNHIPNLFPINERMVSVIESEIGRVAVVMVGATNVGAISLSYDNLRGNTLGRIALRAEQPIVKLHDPSPPVACGERLGTFHMGSTVVLLLDRELSVSHLKIAACSIKYGTSLTQAAPSLDVPAGSR